MSNVRPTQIVFVGTHRLNTYSIFNQNAFPDNTKVIVDASGLRLALFSLHFTSLSEAIQRDRTEFIGALERQRQDMELALTNHPDHICVAMYDGLAYLSQMHSCLNTLKSFLDIYAKLIGKLIQPQNEWSFHKANIEGIKLAGGRLINALRNCSNTTYANDLPTLTLTHSRNWITPAVTSRDKLSHR